MYSSVSIDAMTTAAEQLPILKLEPAHSVLRQGDSIVVDCSTSVSGAPVTWTRESGRSLPYNFRVSESFPIVQDVECC